MEETVLIVVMLVLLFTLCSVPFIATHYSEKRVQKFYDSVNVGDVFVNPEDEDNPFENVSTRYVINEKKDGYILYTIDYVERSTNKKYNSSGSQRSKNKESFHREFKYYDKLR